MLKTNEQLLQEKIEYATGKIKQYEARIELLNEAILDNRRVLDGILQRRLNKTVVLNAMTFTATSVNSSKPCETEVKYEKSLKDENAAYAEEIEKLEDKIKEFKSTKQNLTSILNKTKKSPVREK